MIRPVSECLHYKGNIIHKLDSAEVQMIMINHAICISFNLQVNEQHKPQANPFRVIRRGQSVDASVQTTVQLIPKLGSVKVNALLQRFGTIEAIAKASPQVS